MAGQIASDATHRAFEEYLTGLGVEWSQIPTGNESRPDYTLSRAGYTAIAEVKTIVGNGQVKSGRYDPCKAIIRKMRKARRQLESFESEPRCVVLHSQSWIDFLSPETVAACLFGPGFRSLSPDFSRIDGTPPVLHFFNKKQLPDQLHELSQPVLSPAINRRISAVLIMGAYALSEANLEIWRQLKERQDAGERIQPGASLQILAEQKDVLPKAFRCEVATRVVVLENPNASIAFPADLLSGPFDQYWRQSEEGYRPVWIGERLMDLQREGVPFSLL